MAEPLFIPVILGTVREGNKTRRVADYVTRLLAKREGVETHLVDPAELPFGDLVEREWEMEPRPHVVDAFVREMSRADGFVLVYPEYNHGYPGALKNVLDHVYDEWNRKPFGLVSTGGVSGGMRATEMVRNVVSALDGVPVRASVPVQFVGKTFDEDGPKEDAERWERRFAKLFDELEWWAHALRAARAADA